MYFIDLNFKSIYIFLPLLLLLLFGLRETIGIRIVDSSSHSSPGHRPIFLDYDYSRVMVDESDCPNAVNDPPKISILNDSQANWFFAMVCTAGYPITLEYDGNSPLNVNSKQVLAGATPSNMSRPCYLIYVSRYMHERLMPVGNFTCRSTTLNPEKSTSKYSFLHDQQWRYSDSFSVRHLQRVSINTKSVTKLLIPCRATRASQNHNTTNLLKEDTSGFNVQLREEDGWKTSFDPYSGFTVEFPKGRDENFTNIDGRYLCTDLSSGGNNVEVIVEHAEHVAFPNKTNLTFSSGQVTFECYAGEPVTIKLLNSAGVKLQEIVEKVDVKTSDIYHNAGYFYNAKKTFKTTETIPKGSGKIGCVSTNSGKVFQTWNFDNEYICTCEWNVTEPYRRHYGRRVHHNYDDWSGSHEEFGESPTDHSKAMQGDYYFMDTPYSYGEVTCWNNKAIDVDWTLMQCSNDVECNMIRKSCIDNDCPNYLRNMDHYKDPNMHTNRSSRYINLNPGLLECNADGYISIIKVETDAEANMHFNSKAQGSPLRLQASEDHLYTGDKMLYSCSGRNFDTISPIVWGFEYQDGSWNYSTYTQNPQNYWGGNDEDRMIQSNRNIAIFRYTYLTIPSKKAKRLWCFAPKYNSTEWMKTSIDLKIEDADPAENPPRCPSKSTPSIVMLRSASIPTNRVRLPHLVKESDVMIYEPVSTVMLHCLAKFPVLWYKDGVNITADRESRSNCRSNDGQILSRKLHKSTVQFSVSAFNATGNYTCRSNALHQSRQTSVYIYIMTPENRTTFVEEGHHYIVKHTFDNDTSTYDKWAILPCRMNTPKFIPYLFIDRPEKEPLRIPLQNSYLKFDPKIGFSIDVTNRRVIKSSNTVFYCSDHKDGSFIGIMVTLELTYVQSEPTTTTKSPIGNPTNVTMTPNVNSPHSTITPQGQHATMKTPIKQESSSNTGFIISTIFLTAMCCSCFAIIYHLYQKIDFNNGKNPPPQELDWTNATIHTTTNGCGNNVEFHNNFDTASTAPTNLISDGSSILDQNPAMGNGNGFGILLDENQVRTLQSAAQNPVEDDTSLPSLSDSFSYKKL